MCKNGSEIQSSTNLNSDFKGIWSFALLFSLFHIKIIITTENNDIFLLFTDQMNVSLRKISQNTGLLWPAFSCVRTELKILFLYRQIGVRENLYSGIFYSGCIEKRINIRSVF